jgi:hypothetical protein
MEVGIGGTGREREGQGGEGGGNREIFHVNRNVCTFLFLKKH